MKHMENGLNDSDKLFVIVALWIAAVSLFATAFTLPMLPDEVTIFYRTTDMDAEFYSKYNNLLLVLVSAFPIAIFLTAALLKKHNKIRYNFMSIMIFGIMLSICLGGVTIYGICQQLIASGSMRSVDSYALIATVLCGALSVIAAAIPSVVHSHRFIAKQINRPLRFTYICFTLDRFWNVGAYGYLVTAAVCSFLTGPYAYIPLAVTLIADAVFIFVFSGRAMRERLDMLIYDELD